VKAAFVLWPVMIERTNGSRARPRDLASITPEIVATARKSLVIGIQ
jgi:hypothetical protein